MGTARALSLSAAAAGAGGLLYRLVVAGALVVDVAVGRRVRRLGPVVVEVDAPRELVFDVIAAPYLGKAPREVADRIEVLERGSDMVVAAHRTPVGRSGVATTVESVRFSRPHEVAFRVLRGPVPHVVERYDLQEDGDGTRLVYEGEMGTDLWTLGSLWGDVVAPRWIATVEHSLDEVRQQAEQRAAAHRRREQRQRS